MEKSRRSIRLLLDGMLGVTDLTDDECVWSPKMSSLYG